MKSQDIRLLDVFVLGPFMVYAAAKGRMNSTERLLLAIVGIGTIFYNLRNWQIQQGVEKCS